MSGPQQQLQQQQQLPSLVRNWVHYDNLATKYSKEATAAKGMRDDFEAKILGNLRSSKMENAIIQIGGGERLQCIDEKQLPALSLTKLELYLHSYYNQKGNHNDETDAILRFIKQQKNDGARISKRLRKITTVEIPKPS
jgi:hypothetical protein